MSKNIFSILVAVALLATPALAQTQQKRFYGVIDTYDGTTLVVRTPDGKTASVAVPEGVRIVANGKAKLSDIKPGDFIGSAADKGPDGVLHAEEVHIFPESMRGTGDGQRPMGPPAGQAGPNPSRSMTNGTVVASDPSARTMTNGTVTLRSGRGTVTLTVHDKDGNQTIEVAPHTRVVTVIPGDRSLLKPGVTVSVVAVQKDSGLSATILTAERDGVKPI